MRCDRCGATTGFFSTSYFNTDTLCRDCLERERRHPDYERAKRVEEDAVRRGDYNFPGVGKPADL
jgi:hypothetical protein